MATSAGTQASDVTGVIDTDLSNSEIDNFLDDAEFEAKQAISDYSNALTQTERQQLEKYLAALHIREWYDRAFESASRESASISYEGPSLSALQRAVDQRDPSGTLASTVLRDTSRHVTQTDES